MSTQHRNSSIVPFASGHVRAQLVTILFAVIILLSLIAIASDYIQISLLSRAMAGETITPAEAEANDNRQLTIGGFQFLTYVITAILFLMWIHRAHRNLPALGVRYLKYSPGWAVGGFFVPFLNLVLPFNVVTEIWQASDPNVMDDHSWRIAPSSPLIVWWWMLFLMSNFMGFIIMRMTQSGETISDLLTASWLMLISEAFRISSAILAILVVRAIDARQEEKHRRLTKLEELTAG